MANQVPLSVAGFTALLGAAVVTHTVLCWSGRWRGWSRRALSDQWVLGWAPGFGPLLLGFGLLWLLGEPYGLVIGTLLVLAGGLLLIPGLCYLGFAPRWWGPRWYRRLPARQRRPDIADPFTALMVAASARPRFSSQRQAATAAAGYGEPTARWRASHVSDPDTLDRAHGLARRGAVAGMLTLHQRGLTFAASAWEDRLRGEPTVIALGAVAGARTVPPRAGTDGVVRRGLLWRSLLPRLVVEAADGREYLFEVTFAKRAAARVSELARPRAPR